MLFSQISRKQAFLTHLSFSLSIFFLLAYLIVFDWYPSYYLELDGGDRGLATIFFVDVVLGPGLTLLVFKQGKKGLKFDMTMILLFQAIALSWGIKSVYLSRPALTVFYDGRFACLTHDDISQKDMNRLSGLSKDRPLLAILKKPDTLLTYSQFVNDAYLADSSEIYYYGDKFEIIDGKNLKRIDHYELDVEEGIERAKQRQALSLKNWQTYAKQHPNQKGVKYFPLKCRYKVGMAVFDLSTGKIVDTVDVYTKRAISNVKLKYSAEEIKHLKSISK